MTQRSRKNGERRLIGREENLERKRKRRKEKGGFGRLAGAEDIFI